MVTAKLFKERKRTRPRHLIECCNLSRSQTCLLTENPQNNLVVTSENVISFPFFMQICASDLFQNMLSLLRHLFTKTVQMGFDPEIMLVDVPVT